MKRHVTLILFSSFILIFVLNCSNRESSFQSNFKYKDIGKKENIVQTVSVDDIKSIITEKEYTILFLYTTWCSASEMILKDDIKNALDTLNTANLNIAIIGLASKADSIQRFTKECGFDLVNYYLGGSNGMPLNDKSQINKVLRAIFEDYKKANHVPITLLCSKDFRIIERGGFPYLLNKYYALN